MKSLRAWGILVVCAVLPSCGVKTPDAVPVPVVAPTMTPAARTPAVAMGPVVLGLGEVQAKNVRLRGEVETGRRYSELLSDRLAVAEAAGAANAEDLRVMRDAAKGLERALATAKEELQEQWETLVDVVGVVAAKTAEIAAGEQEKTTLRLQVEALNDRVSDMQTVAFKAEKAREAAVGAVRLVEGRMASETKLKGRFFRWGLTMTILVVLYVAGRIYRILP